MRKLQDYARSHPFQTITILAVAIASGAIIAQDHVVTGVCVFAAIYALWCLAYARNTRRLLCVALAASMLAVPRQAHAIQYALGGVVLLVSAGVGFVGCRAINCARRVARPVKTNTPPEEFRVAGEGEYGAAFFWGESCYSERRTTNAEPVPVRFTLNIFVESVSNITTTLSGDVGSGFAQSLDEFKEELNACGLSMPVAPVAFEAYARNRHPVEAEAVPIKFDWNTHTATIGHGGVTVRVDSSADLEHWRPIMTLDVEAGQRLDVSDATESGACFYRVTLSGGPTP